MSEITIFIRDFSHDIGRFWNYIYKMLKFAYPNASYVSTIEELIKVQEKNILFVVSKPRTFEELMPYFSDWNKAICWSFEAVNTNSTKDRVLLETRQSMERVSQHYRVCHLDEESSKQLGCTWLPIGYSPVLEAAEKKYEKSGHSIFMGDCDSGHKYRYNVIHISRVLVMSDSPHTIQDTNEIIHRFAFGLHVPSTVNYLNVNWHRLMLYYANKTIPILIGPDDMQVPNLPFIRVKSESKAISCVKYMEYDTSLANKAYDEVKIKYDFKNLVDGVLYR